MFCEMKAIIKELILQLLFFYLNHTEYNKHLIKFDNFYSKLTFLASLIVINMVRVKKWRYPLHVKVTLETLKSCLLEEPHTQIFSKFFWSEA